MTTYIVVAQRSTTTCIAWSHGIHPGHLVRSSLSLGTREKSVISIPLDYIHIAPCLHITTSSWT
uniref:Uncharacterized protein n=1 Tax=Arundo donax TaxID=35708 RepID=A0A0A9B8V6_ARUDO